MVKTFDEAKELVKTYEIDFLKVAPKSVGGEPTYICPRCGSGSGKNGTGIVRDPNGNGQYYTCFACGTRQDIIGWWQDYSGLSGDDKFFQACTSLYEHFGIETDYSKKRGGVSTPTAKTITQKERTMAEPKKPLPDLSVKITRYHKNLLNRVKRGEEDKCRYVGADSPLFNENALETAQQPIFLVEGQIDALSVIEVGGEAIALGTNGLKERFKCKLREIKQARTPIQPFVIALDNDEKGREGADRTERELRDLGFSFYRITKFDSEGKCKDPNEALTADRADFEKIIKTAIENARKVDNTEKTVSNKTEDEAEQVKKKYSEQYSEHCNLDKFLALIKSGKLEQYVPTGFEKLDKALRGGLRKSETYILGAMSSLGKTAFCMQIASNAAKMGEDVLIFSMEMTRTDLTARNISQLTYEMTEDESVAKSGSDIQKYSEYKNYSKESRNAIEQAIKQYDTFAEHLFIVEGTKATTIDKIKEHIEQHYKCRGVYPTVIIDYLQIIPNEDARLSDKQRVDNVSAELKRLARDKDIAVLAISSINRSNYNGKPDMTAFKESGNIEYDCDCVIMMQYEGCDRKDFDREAAMSETPVRLELRLMKQRNGRAGMKIKFNFYSEFSFYEENKLTAMSAGRKR